MSHDVGLLLRKIRDESYLHNYEKISSDILANIAKIKAICKKKYFDQLFYGNAALNRQMLLDTTIADHLTPLTIIAIFSVHANTTSLKKSPIGLFRNGSGFISLASALYFGFNEGVDVIRFMPNNERDYNREKYDDQKRKFDENTTRIIENIKIAASMLGIAVQQEALPQEEQGSLTEQFQLIENVIAKIKKNRDSNTLLYAPAYSSNDIRFQSIQGFRVICDILKIQYKVNKNRSVTIDEPLSVNDFVDKFLCSEAAFLNGIVIHLFYDRLHLEACIEQNTAIYFNNKKYYLRDILRKMIKKCEISANEIVKEQFFIRLKLCDLHLKNLFPNYYKNERSIPYDHEQVSTNFPLRYLKRIIARIDVGIDKRRWDCSEVSLLYSERNFLSYLVENYDEQSMTECLALAKKLHPVGYKSVTEQLDLSFYFNLLKPIDDYRPVQGPRTKTNATLMLEELLYLLLQDHKKISCNYNVLNELEITIDNRVFNITLILLSNPDFEHIHFSENQLDYYANYIKKFAWNKPLIISDHSARKIPSPEDYALMDKKGECNYLHYAEKLAIGIYTGLFHKEIQDFLREHGRNAEPYFGLPGKFTHLVREILLCTAIASHGLSKSSLNPSSKHHQFNVNYRSEHCIPTSGFFIDRVNSLQLKQPVLERGFISTTSAPIRNPHKWNTFTLFTEPDGSNVMGKKVSGVSFFPDEKEVLYPPGTQIRYQGYFKVGKCHFFLASPLRTPLQYNDDDYSNRMAAKHELEIIAKLFENYIIRNKNSVFKRKLNSQKYQNMIGVKKEIELILNDSNDNLYHNICHLLQIITTLRTTPSKSTHFLWEDKIDKLLQEALVRVQHATEALETEKMQGMHKDPQLIYDLQI